MNFVCYCSSIKATLPIEIRKIMKKLILAAAAAVLAMGALTGCSSQPSTEQTANEVDEYIGVCMDTATQERVDDDNCKSDQPSPQYTPYFYSYGSMIPGLGFPMIGGYPTVYAPYRMGFGSTGGSSTNYQPKAPMAYPKGYVAPPNPVYKQATPSTTPLKSASEAAAKYSAPKSNSSTGSKPSTGSNSSTGSKSSTNTAPKTNPYSYKGSTSKGSTSKGSTSSKK
jgi:hypothetical protein